MEIPENLQYTQTHEWVDLDGDTATIGLTDYAQEQMGDLVFINLPEVGDTVTAGDAFADAESVKAVSDVLSPVSGTISEINEELLDTPELVNQDPYGAWFIRVSDAQVGVDLIDPEAYPDFCEE